jgi:hypothetical protein
LSDAPHALPQAAGFSAGLSDAPQAVPHAALACVFSFSFHPAMFVNAISLTSCFRNPVDGLSPRCMIIITQTGKIKKQPLFYNLVTKK